MEGWGGFAPVVPLDRFDVYTVRRVARMHGSDGRLTWIHPFADELYSAKCAICLQLYYADSLIPFMPRLRQERDRRARD